MTAEAAPQDTLNSVAQGDAPVLERLISMNLDSLKDSGLDARTYFLTRLAALVAMDAAPVSYLINLGLAADAGVTIEEAQGTLVAIAPVVGSARVASAAGKILRAFGLAVAATEAAAEEEA
ncbi:carboxymuconolactone decarboxylase family protein [Pseudonocardia acidicola]|uniref:Carboxymuconolactone decarboxylase family protein n=1 Tax=Pseudonocardia acidicola TaxID=2724939 RepID=A0ABX1S9Z0_9PSEU|nr:carboxymuconolactone decarboxylase family protein [Pseudonocardia acidicola]NMH97920.1 carboxymuconolactone decarboxylase family protein [Pseudonocardia acidicola]